MEATTTERNRGTVLGPRFGEAVAYALEVHSGQCRAGTTQPYVSHLLRVAGLVLEDGGGEPEAIAALLHDAAEDQGGTPRLWDIRRRFGPEVATIVKELTDSSEYPRPPWRRRKERYLVHLAGSSQEALRVSLADKLVNVRSLTRDYRIQGEDLWEKSGKSKRDVLWYYRTLTARFEELRPGPLADELSRAVGEFEALMTAIGTSRAT
jgi:(p)ppGpp synthase/HD superfamily hydrolase